MTELLFPELANLKGGKKQHWLRANRELILALYEKIPFNDLCEKLNCKAETLTHLLQEAERIRRPVITKADKANNNAIMAMEYSYKAEREVARLDVELAEHINDNDAKFGDLADFCQLQSNLWSIMSRRMRQHHSISPRISHNIYLVKPIRKVELTENRHARLSIYRGPKRLQLSGPQTDSKHTGHPSHRRPGRV